jgi:hypothetical protein
MAVRIPYAHVNLIQMPILSRIPDAESGFLMPTRCTLCSYVKEIHGWLYFLLYSVVYPLSIIVITIQTSFEKLQTPFLEQVIVVLLSQQVYRLVHFPQSHYNY